MEKNILTSTEFVKDTAQSGPHVAVTGKSNFSTIMEIIKSDYKFRCEGNNVSVLPRFYAKQIVKKF